MSDELKPLSFGSDSNSSNFSNDFSISSKSSYNNQEAEEFVPLRNTQNIEEIKNQDSNFVFFFGTAESGKSVILSSMLYALRTQFGVFLPKIGTPNSKEAMVLLADFFENIRQGILPERTTRDQVTRMDLVFEPNNRSKKVPPINLTFLETSGENHNEIRRGGSYHSSIDQYLRANIPLTFILVTGYNSAHKEDTLLNEFLFMLEQKSRNLRSANVILVISKWDKSGSQETTEEELDFFIKERLPMTYQLLETYGLNRTYYTIGELMKEDGEEHIVSLNLHTAELLSKWLYRSIVGYDLDYPGTFWEGIKWSLFGDK